MRVDCYPFIPPALIWLSGLLLLAAVIWSLRLLQQRNVPPFWQGVLGGLRLLALGVLLLMLLRPVVRITRDRPIKEERLILIDTSLSMSRRDTEDGSSRLEQLLKRIEEPGWRRRHLHTATLHWFAFDEQIRPLEAADAGRLVATGRETDYATALEEALMLYQWGLEDSAAQRVKPQVLLLSDGGDRGRSDPRSVATRLGVAVDFLAPETVVPEPEPQMAISDVQHNPRVLLGSELRMQVTVRQEGCAGSGARVVLFEGEERLLEQPVSFTAAREEQQFMLQFAPGQAGVQRYRVALEPEMAAGLAPPDSGTGRVVTVRVESQFHDLLVIEPEWRWHFPYLRRVVEDDPAFAFSAFLSRGSGVFVQFGEPQRRVNLSGFPRSLAELEGFDTLILGDVRPEELPPSLAAALPLFVAERGKSLVVVAGPRIATWLRYPDLAALLPVELTPGSGLLDGPIAVRIADEARQSAFFFAAPGESSLLRWQQLPDMDQIYAPQRKRPAATVLLESSTKRNAFGPLIVAAIQPFGRGQVLYLATDTLWKWQMLGTLDNEENTPFNTFWRQALRVVRPERLAGEGVELWLQPERSRVEQGREVVLHARLEGSAERQVQLAGRYQIAGAGELPLAFNPLPEQPGRFRAAFGSEVAGTYEVVVEVTGGGEILGSAATQIEVVPRPAESAREPVDLLALERLAAATGGRNLALAGGGRETDAEARRQPLERQTTAYDLWSNLTLLFILAVVLGCDWLVRLVRGFV